MRPHAETSRLERSDVGLRSERGPILLSVMLATGLVAIDATILATAVPSIVRDGVLAPAIHDVYVASALAAVVLVLTVLIIPRRVETTQTR